MMVNRKWFVENDSDEMQISIDAEIFHLKTLGTQSRTTALYITLKTRVCLPPTHTNAVTVKTSICILSTLYSLSYPDHEPTVVQHNIFPHLHPSTD